MSEEMNPVTLTAAQRRARRKQRILAEGEDRLSKILNVDGEKRQAPCMEGESSYQPTSSEVSPLPLTTEVDSDAIGKTSPQLINQPNKRNLDFLDNVPPQNLNNLILKRPKYMEFIDKSRFWIALGLGLFFAIFTSFSYQVGNIILPSIIIIATYETFVFKARKMFYPRSNNVMKAILTAGMDQDMVVTFSLLGDLLWEIGLDLLIVIFAFISTKIVMVAIQGFTV